MQSLVCCKWALFEVVRSRLPVNSAESSSSKSCAVIYTREELVADRSERVYSQDLVIVRGLQTLLPNASHN